MSQFGARSVRWVEDPATVKGLDNVIKRVNSLRKKVVQNAENLRLPTSELKKQKTKLSDSPQSN